MFTRGVVSLHIAHLPVPKTLTSKSRVSISSKLIETKGLQLHYFGHLRKTGGRGSYQLVYTALLPVPISLAAKSNHSQTLVPSAFREGCAGPPAVVWRGWLYNKWVSIRAEYTHV